MERTASRPNLLIPFLLIIAALVCIIALPSLIASLPAAQVYTAPVVEPATRSLPIINAPVYHDHATTKHGPDAEAVRKCLLDTGPVSIWEKRNSMRNHLLCILPDGRIGDQLVQLDDNGVWHEITSFIRDESSMRDVMRALKEEAKLVWELKGL